MLCTKHVGFLIDIEKIKKMAGRLLITLVIPLLITNYSSITSQYWFFGVEWLFQIAINFEYLIFKIIKNILKIIIS
jgi:hypothetical protein